MKQLGSQFMIDADKKDLVLAAIKQLPGKERDLEIDPHNHFAFIGFETLKRDGKGLPIEFRYHFMDAQTAEEALEAWHWQAETDVDGNITGLSFMTEKDGDYDILFAQIAPFVEPGSWIEMVDEEYHHWIWKFRDGKMYEVSPRVHLSDRKIHCLFDI